MSYSVVLTENGSSNLVFSKDLEKDKVNRDGHIQVAQAAWERGPGEDHASLHPGPLFSILRDC